MLAVEEGFACKQVNSFTLKEEDLTKMDVGQSLESPKFDVPGSGGLKWWIRVYPAGKYEDESAFLSVFLHVNKPVKAHTKFIIFGSTIQKSFTTEFRDPLRGRGPQSYASHEDLSFLFDDGMLTLTCIVEFDIPPPNDPSKPSMFQLFRHVPTDVVLVVGSDQVPAHKGFVSLISPVFQAMFSHDTIESKSNKIEIADFDCTTVKSALGYCYGREMKDLSVEAAVNILRFCDKYFVTAVIEEFEKLPLLIPSIENFCEVIRYAYDCNRNELMADYCKFFKSHQDKVKKLAEFADLPPNFVIELIKKAFDLKTDFDVLTHAHKNDIGFIVDYLEEPLIKSMTIDNFCPAVKFAWQCSRDTLKQVCAAFLNDNREVVTDLKDFFNLAPETVCEVLKAGHTLKHGTV